MKMRLGKRNLTVALKQTSLYAFILALTHTHLGAQERVDPETAPRYFEGIYVGVNLGRQQIRGSIPFNESFLSAQQSRWVAEFTLGHRWQFINDRVTFSLEVHAGITDGNLNTQLANNPEASVEFSNNAQVGLGYDLGYVIDQQRKLLLHVYIRQVRRGFDITLANNGGPTQITREDIVSFRYGLGAAYHISRHFNTRLLMGTFSEDLQQDFTAFQHPEVSIGVVYQF